MTPAESRAVASAARALVEALRSAHTGCSAVESLLLHPLIIDAAAIQVRCDNLADAMASDAAGVAERSKS